MKDYQGNIPKYRRSTWFILHLANPLARYFSGRLGWGTSSGIRILKVKGSKTGKIYSIPIRLLELDKKKYLVALQGETFWVKNLRKQKGNGQIEFGGRTTDFSSKELPDQEKLPILRAYLKKWWSVSRPLTTVTSPDAPYDEIRKAAPLHPVFELTS